MKIVQQNKPQETEASLNNGRKIKVNFHTINYIENMLNFTEIPFLQLNEKHA